MENISIVKYLISMCCQHKYSARVTFSPPRATEEVFQVSQYLRSTSFLRVILFLSFGVQAVRLATHGLRPCFISLEIRGAKTRLRSDDVFLIFRLIFYGNLITALSPFLGRASQAVPYPDRRTVICRLLY